MADASAGARWRRGALVVVATLACRVKPPEPEPEVTPPPPVCAGTSVLARELAEWYEPVLPAMACEPAPGRAGWVTTKQKQRLVETAQKGEAKTSAERPPPLVVIALAGADQRDAAAERKRLAALSGAQAELHLLDGRTARAEDVRAVFKDIASRAAPTSHVRLVVLGARASGGAPFGCVPLADGCVPLAEVQQKFADLPGRSSAAVIVGDDPAPALALFADGRTAVAAFRDDAGGRAALKKFWAARRDLDGDGALALRERFAAADPPEASALFVDPFGNATWTEMNATPRFPLELLLPRDLEEVERVAKGLLAGEWLVVYFADRGCVDCKFFDRRHLVSLVNERRGQRYAAFDNAAEILGELGRASPLTEPVIAYYDRRGRQIGFADDPTRPLGSLPATLVPAEQRRQIFETWLLGQDYERVKLAAAALVRLDGGDEGALLRLARRIHEDGSPELVAAVMSALARGKWVGAAAAPEVLSHIDHPDDRVRMAVLDAMLAIQAPAEDVLCAVISLVPDRNPEIRAKVRLLLFSFLRAIEPGVPAMATLLEHEDPAVRAAAVQAFAEVNAGPAAAAALPGLVRIYFSDDPIEVRRLALVAITRMGPAAAPALSDLAPHVVGEPDVETRALLAGIMGNIGAPAACAREGLELLAREDVPLPRRKAAQALAQIDEALHPEAHE